MTFPLYSAPPDDKYARFYFTLVPEDGTYFRPEAREAHQADDKTSWIEFWAADAKACKAQMKTCLAKVQIIDERRQKRKGDPSVHQMLKEQDEANVLFAEMLAARVKAWRLFDKDGTLVDLPVTFENAKSAFIRPDDNAPAALLGLATEFCSETANFQMRASAVS